MGRRDRRGKTSRDEEAAQLGHAPGIEIWPGSTRSAAARLFVHCFPLMLADAVRRAHLDSPGRFILADDGGAALAPGLEDEDPGLVVSTAWIDLSAGPVLVRTPHMRGRQFILSLIDPAGEIIASLGSRTGDDAGLCLAIVGAKWKGELPSGFRAGRASGASLWAVSRIHAHSTLDYPETVALAQRQGMTRPQADHDAAETAKTAWAPPWPPCLQQIEELPPAVFFQRLERVLARAPQSLRRTLLPLVAGLKSQLGGPPDFRQWSSTFAEALAAGFEDGMVAIRSAAEAALDDGGSAWRPLPGGLRHGPDDAVARAAHAYAAFGAPLPEDRLTLVCDRDDCGRPLSGAHSYRIHFEPDALPPTQDFWRLSATPPAARGQRQGLSDRGELALNEDGSLDLIIQRDPPSIFRIRNWLPVPDGSWSLTMRLYGPARAALGRTWRMPPPERLDGGRRAEADGRLRVVSPTSTEAPARSASHRPTQLIR
jgi:hypothetical protein